MSLLKVEGLRVQFKHHAKAAEAVRDISFSVEPGECVGIIGESGSGKSTAMRALLGLLPEGAAVSWKEIRLMEEIILPPGAKLGKRYQVQMNRIRGSKAAMIFQDPAAYLNPAVKIGKQITETIRAHKGSSAKAAKEQALSLLTEVGIRNPGKRFGQYPFELSGGMQQRVSIAAALAGEPKLLIADEPTTALDATVQKQILELLQRIAAETGTAIIMVTHDLSAAAVLCDRLLVMKAGKIIEEGEIQTVLREPQEVYTKELIQYSLALQKGAGSSAAGEVLLKAEGLGKTYLNQHFGFGKERDEGVRQVSLEIKAGEVFGVVGESGSGKTTLAGLAAGILKPTSGRIHYCNTPAIELGGGLRKEVQMIFQHNYASFNPRFKIGQILAEPLIYQSGDDAMTRQEKIIRMLSLVGLDVDDQEKYPHQFSGGQQQRIGIARALIAEPKLVICDEPVSSLDVSIQAQILELLKKVQKQEDLAYLFISHDLGVIRHMSHRMGVMYQGSMVEQGDTEALYQDPWHPYTKALLNAALVADPRKARKKKAMQPKAVTAMPEEGCPYYPYCGYVMHCCERERPQSYRFGDREVACFLYSEEHSGRRSPDYIMTVQI